MKRTLVRVARDIRDATRDYYMIAENARRLFNDGHLEQVDADGWIYHDPQCNFVGRYGTIPRRGDRVIRGV